MRNRGYYHQIPPPTLEQQYTNAPSSENENTFRRIASSQPLSRLSNLSSVEVVTTARALVFYQHHHWFHSRSCFKKTKRTPRGDVCRMFMPKQTCPQTKWTDDNRIETKRCPGNEYINTYVPVINALFKCNHDIKFLSAGEGPEKAYYTIKFSTKPQQDIENPWALHLHAFDKASERLLQDSDDPIALGRRRVQSMCCTLTNPHEVSAPMACLYIINESAMYSSHSFVKLHLMTILRALFQQHEQLDVTLESDGSGRVFKPSSVWFDYVYRPTTLEDLDLMSFVAHWERKKSKTGKRFMNSHVLYESHSLFGLPAKKIVTVCHKRLSDIRRSDLSIDELLRYQQSLMALFRPFRGAKDFEKEGTSFDDFFQRWFEKEAPPTAHTFVKHNTDYYASRELLTTQNDPDVDRYFRCQDDDDELEDGSVQDMLDSDENNQAENEEYNLSDEFVDAPVQPTKNIDMLEKSNICSSLAAFSTINSSLPIGNFAMSIDDVEKSMRGEATVESFATVTPSNPSLLDIYPDLPTRVKLLQIAVTNIEHPTQSEPTTHRSNPAELQDFPPLQNVSSAFQLNEKQNKMFAKIGTDLLTSCLVGHDPEKQIIGFLGGLPGAGKSRVIGSIQSLADKWKSSDAVVTAAYQGVAAQAANGQTIHKLFGWSVNKRKRWTPTTAQKERFAKVKLLILDEISTCDVGILGKVDATLRILLNCPDKLFGGIHVLLVGDWLQQLPVAGQPAFLSPGEILSSSGRPKKDTPEYLDRIREITAYRALNWVVILTENMRHQEDPVWMSILDKWRVGNYDQKDIDLVNKVAYEENWGSDRATLKGYCPIIVTSNAPRVEFNVSAIRAFCAEARVPLHRFPAEVTRARYPLTQTQRKSLDCIRDDKTKGMSINLELAIGSTVQCTKNVSPLMKLANGSIGTVVAFSTTENDVVQVTTSNGVEEHLHSHPPDIVFVHLKDYSSHPFVASLPPGVVPICKRKETGVRVAIRNRSFSLTISQAPVVPAYSLTTEKCQGLTVHKMILAPLRHPTRRIPQTSSFYVAVTRVTTLKQLYLMAPLTKQFLAYFTPKENVLRESFRLQTIEEDQVR